MLCPTLRTTSIVLPELHIMTVRQVHYIVGWLNVKSLPGYGPANKTFLACLCISIISVQIVLRLPWIKCQQGAKRIGQLWLIRCQAWWQHAAGWKVPKPKTSALVIIRWVDMLILSQESLPFGRRIIVITSNQTPDIPIICVNLLRLEPSCSHVLQLKKAVSILQYWMVPNLKHLWDGTWSAMYLGPPVAGLLQPTAQLAKCKHVQGMQ